MGTNQPSFVTKDTQNLHKITIVIRYVVDTFKTSLVQTKK